MDIFAVVDPGRLVVGVRGGRTSMVGSDTINVKGYLENKERGQRWARSSNSVALLSVGRAQRRSRLQYLSSRHSELES